MITVKALTHRHPIFLKEAYKMDGIVDLINDERQVKLGCRFIKFDSDKVAFGVYIKTLDGSVRFRNFNNLGSAVNCARRV